MERGENDAIGERGRERDRFVFALTLPPFPFSTLEAFFHFFSAKMDVVVVWYLGGRSRPPLPSRNLCWLMQPLHDLVRGGWKEGEFLQELLLGE